MGQRLSQSFGGSVKRPQIFSSASLKPKPIGSQESHLRIFHFNDCYLLDNLPALATCVRTLSEGFKTGHAVTVLSGDFIAPSLLSSLDHGRGMVAVLNAVPVDMVCFGNHEGDVPLPSLVTRMDEFEGIWLNSNLPQAVDPNHRCVPHFVLELAEGRKVAFMGFCLGGGKDRLAYRVDAFGGHAREIVPVLEALPNVVNAAKLECPDVDVFVPLTHQVLADDIQFSTIGKELGVHFPVILGGHDHEPIDHETAEASRILKAGSDCMNVYVIDLKWSIGVPAASPPDKVEIELIRLGHPTAEKGPKPTLRFDPDPEIVALAKEKLQLVDELQSAVLAEVPPGSLSSVGVRHGESTMATFLASRLRDAGEADCCLLNAGAVRANKVYENGDITFADLQTECPFPTNMIKVYVVGSCISAIVACSRKVWLLDPPAENNSALHCDDGMVYDKVTCEVTQIRHKRINRSILYTLLIDAYMLKKNTAFAAYAAAYPDRMPPSDSGLPPLPMLVTHFVRRLWLQLVDTNEDGNVDSAELAAFLELEQPYHGIARHKGSRVVKTATKASQRSNRLNTFTNGKMSSSNSVPRTSVDCVTPKSASNLSRFSASFDGTRVFSPQKKGRLIQKEELAEIIKKKLGSKRASSLIVDQCFKIADINGDGNITKEELYELFVDQATERQQSLLKLLDPEFTPVRRLVVGLPIFDLALRQGSIIQSVHGYYIMCRSSSDLIVITPNYNVWQQNDFHNECGKMIPAVRKSQKDNVCVFFFDAGLSLHQRHGAGLAQDRGSCNLRDVTTGSFVEFTDGLNGFRREVVGRHTLIHHSSEYRNVLVQVNILDAMVDDHYFMNIINKYAVEGDKLIVYMDVLGTIMSLDALPRLDRDQHMMSNLFGLLEAIPKAPFQLKAPGEEFIHVKSSIGLSDLIHQISLSDPKLEAEFAKRENCERFLDELVSVVDLRWYSEIEGDARKPANLLAEFDFYKEEIGKKESMVCTDSGLLVSWLDCLNSLRSGRHSIVLNSFGMESHQVIKDSMPDCDKCLRTAVNFADWSDADRSRFNSYFHSEGRLDGYLYTF